MQIGSPTAMAQSSLEQSLKLSAKSHGLYVPSGAFWGSEDIQKMADRGNLQVSIALYRPSVFQKKLSVIDCWSGSLQVEYAVKIVKAFLIIKQIWNKMKYMTDTHTHTHPFNGPFSVTTRVSRYQKGKTNLDFTEARDSEWQWHQLGHMHVCTLLETDNHAINPPLTFLQAGCHSCRPANSVKALKGYMTEIQIY